MSEFEFILFGLYECCVCLVSCFECCVTPEKDEHTSDTSDTSDINTSYDYTFMRDDKEKEKNQK